MSRAARPELPDLAARTQSQLPDLALGCDPLDRRADLRSQGWAAVPPRRRVVLLDRKGRAAVRRSGDGPVELAVLTQDNADTELGGDPAPTGLMLGVDRDGQVWCARVVPDEDPAVPPDSQWSGLRDVGLRLSDDQRGILAVATALANWHRAHPRCPRCGCQTAVAGLGWWRSCPEDGSDHFPRTDPAVIALLLDDEDNALLGRQTRWPDGAFSTLAGFVEPGESAESAVVREIVEEVALRPTAARYIGSQPWPFPASLMLGFHATIPGIRPAPTPDGVEIAEARWIARDELAPLCQAQQVRLPGRLSIAHHLIARWYGQPLPEPWCRW